MSQQFLKKYMFASIASIIMIGASYTNAETQIDEVTEHESHQTDDTQQNESQLEPNSPNIDTGEAVEPSDEESGEPAPQEDDHQDQTETPPTDIESKPEGNTTEQTDSPSETSPEPPKQSENHEKEQSTINNSAKEQDQSSESHTSTQHSDWQQNHEVNSNMAPSAVSGLNSSFKYNPLALERYRQYTDDGNDKAIRALAQKDYFKDNQFLNQLQQDSDYFRYQSFRPLATKDYYKNLDKQVLGLITEEFGTMPDLKRASKKATASSQHEDKEQQIEQKQTYREVRSDKGEDKDTSKEKKRSFNWLIFCALGIVFSSVIYFLFNRKSL
ncbi:MULTISPECIES: SdrH family protein [unclassified Staphylococcus]|uniref:SdrH family protein n=1 Tax=unclassified Staphylococcus TaxID=91994 RepID=UPI0021D31A6B|nr:MULTISPECIES: SdrH family protein [unclassified Staphylococcus]UXR77810.1 SdrH family protein [Staphylococcus sp. IVB6227]UXR81969.1 SdrH family protein [Staphylococcus sp. IVB6214]